MDISKLSDFCDYFVVCSAESSSQVEGICDGVLKRCKENNIAIHHFEKDKESRWVLVDLFDVVLHIFIDEMRDFYNLEHLWADAKKVRIPRKKNKA